MRAAVIPAIILVGGVGSRLRPVTGDLPKPMAPVAGRPFLAWLIEFLRGSGLDRIVLSAGYGAETIRDHFGNGADLGLTISYSVEQQLLGTGGAIKQGAGLIADDRFLVLNGDSFAQINLEAFQAFHRQHGGPLSLALVRVKDAGRFGAVDIDGRTGEIRAFDEKQKSGGSLINAGMYLMERRVADAIPAGVVSFERDVLPGLLKRSGETSKAYGFPVDGFFVDIGVPEDYRKLVDNPAPLLQACRS